MDYFSECPASHPYGDLQSPQGSYLVGSGQCSTATAREVDEGVVGDTTPCVKPPCADHHSVRKSMCPVSRATAPQAAILALRGT